MSRNSASLSAKENGSSPLPEVRSLPTRSGLASALRLLDAVPGDELLVAGQNVIALADFAREMELRFADAVGRDRDRPALARVGDRALGHRLVDRPLDLGAGATKKPLAVAEALVARVETAVDELRHGYPALFTRMYHSTSRRTWRSV